MKTQQKSIKETIKQWQNDPANWKWGRFYYNKKDGRIFPPISGFGWMVNFAHWDSFIVGLALSIIVLAIGKYVSPQ